jgi:Flp pilus assembly protein TadD
MTVLIYFRDLHFIVIEEVKMSGRKSWALGLAVALALALPQASRAADDLAVAAIRNHDWATAERVLQEGLQQDSNNLSLQLNLAWVYAQTGRKEEAAALYREILKRDEDRFASISAPREKSMSLLAKQGLALLDKK